MSNFKIALALGGMTLAMAATAQAAQMTDVQYVRAARCEALASSPALGKGDSHALEALLRQQERARSQTAVDIAQQAQEDARRQARTAGAYEKASLIAERDGYCQALVSGGAMASAR
jgi:hypothetical protein